MTGKFYAGLAWYLRFPLVSGNRSPVIPLHDEHPVWIAIPHAIQSWTSLSWVRIIFLERGNIFFYTREVSFQKIVLAHLHVDLVRTCLCFSVSSSPKDKHSPFFDLFVVDMYWWMRSISSISSLEPVVPVRIGLYVNVPSVVIPHYPPADHRL